MPLMARAAADKWSIVDFMSKRAKSPSRAPFSQKADNCFVAPELDAAQSAQVLFCQNLSMSRVRILLVLLIAFTLPWQGVAAATRVHCQAMAGSAAAMPESQHADHAHHAHNHASSAEAADGRHAHAAGASTATVDSKAECKAFCCAATISDSMGQMIVPAPSLPQLPEILAVRPSHEPNGFERPPRT